MIKSTVNHQPPVVHFPLPVPRSTAYSLQPSSRNGIALIMALGVLSVMLIMAVAFAVSMRTERLAAGNYADSVRARQLVQTGLGRALNDLANQLGTNGLKVNALDIGGTNYPPWAVTNSSTNTSINTSGRLYLLYSASASPPANSATNFVPRALWDAATNADQLGAANHWLAVDSVVYLTNDLGILYVASSNRMGVVKYLIINCSGLLDANFAGGHPSGRGTGTNPTEIAINNMPDFESGGSTAFLNNREDDYRYETLEELTVLNQAAFDPYPSNFTVYSHAPAGYWPANNSMASNQVNLWGTSGEIKQRKSAISNGFVQAGFTLEQADIVFDNLYNYLAPGSIPLTPGAFDTANFVNLVKAVPMINEILLESFPDGPGARNVITFELWFPFLTPAPAGYQLRVQIDLSSGNDIPETTSIIPIVGTNFAYLSFTNLDGSVNSPYRFTIQKAEVLNAAPASAPVDMLLDPFTNSIAVTIGNMVSYQCIDPRVNWNLFDASQWTVYPGSDTLGETNAATLSYMAANDCDKDGAMYVRSLDEPLQSVGELGYLFYGIPWKTVKLYGPNLHRVFDVFAIGTNAFYIYVTNTAAYRGRVNPNTRQTNVLAAVFSNMPINEYPGQAGSNLTGVALEAVVSDVLADVGYTNRSQVARNFTAFPGAATNELQKEAIFRNSIELFSVRQNLFTIIIEALVASGGNIPSRPIRQRAVALVWRDPYTGEMFVRSIKWLKD